MLTGELKSEIDKVWDTFWTGGVSYFLGVIEQITRTCCSSARGDPNRPGRRESASTDSLRTVTAASGPLHRTCPNPHIVLVWRCTEPNLDGPLSPCDGLGLH